ncbi:MAG: glycerol-3-phosphate 1-O-acyltransferase PlsY [Gemmatimonadetes bacterium]|nr:glycerol-3-phosphate 1-O-acyltransferase PlsY [Gemmatimonadota bacterium]
MSPFVLLALAYGAGATPTSFWLGKAVYGVDLRTKGSENLGGTNTFRVLGWKAAVPVILVDVGKGWLPVWYFPQIQPGASPSTWALAYGGAAILGHVFSFWVGFKGGKGIATSGGVLLGLAPVAVVICLGVWIGAASVTRMVSVASLSAALTLPLVVYLLPQREGSTMVWFAGGISLFVMWSHRSNIRRLLRGEESSFRKAGPERSPGPSPELNSERGKNSA